MENKVLVSIIMPAYNASEFIQESIDSVIAQTYDKWELIIIDDGSIDDTSMIVKSNILKDDRIKLFYQENSKQGKARNLGIENADGEYLAFLDSDDLWLPHKLEVQLKEFENYDVDLVFSDSYFFYDTDSKNRNLKMNTLNSLFKGLGALDSFLVINRIPNLTVLVKKETILSVNGFSEKNEIQNAEDYHLWLKLLIEGATFYGSDKVLASYRRHSNSVTSNDVLSTKQKIEVYYDLIQKYPEVKQKIRNALKQTLRKQFNKCFLSRKEMYSRIKRDSFYLGKQHFYILLSPIIFILSSNISHKILNKILYA